MANRHFIGFVCAVCHWYYEEVSTPVSFAWLDCTVMKVVKMQAAAARAQALLPQMQTDTHTHQRPQVQ